MIEPGSEPVNGDFPAPVPPVQDPALADIRARAIKIKGLAAEIFNLMADGQKIELHFRISGLVIPGKPPKMGNLTIFKALSVIEIGTK